MKTIFRTNPQKEFTVLANRMLRDRTLSFKARGMLAMIMTHSEDWEVHASWIGEQGTEGREAIASGLTELESSGYVQYQQIIEESTGQFAGGMWTFCDTPCPENQRTNKTRWQEKYAAAQASAGVEKPAGNRGNAPRDTGTRRTAETTGSRETGSQHTGTPRDGFPSTKKEPGLQKQPLAEETRESPGAVPGKIIDVLMEESPGDLMGWKEIGAALLAAYGRPAHDIERMWGDDGHWLVKADQQCTREELASLVRFIKKPYDRNNPLLVSRATKMSKLLPNFREQIGLALQVCPPPRQRPASAKPAEPAAPPVSDEEHASRAASAAHHAELLRRKIRGGPGAAEATRELEALEAAANC